LQLIDISYHIKFGDERENERERERERRKGGLKGGWKMLCTEVIYK
jgi:hypothetical protein